MFKIILVAVSMIALHSTAGELDGKTFCRTVGGGLGGPKGKTGQHCVEFKDDQMKDNANTFFGNPPTNSNYVLVGNKILSMIDGKLISSYAISFTSLDSLLYGNIELTLKK